MGALRRVSVAAYRLLTAACTASGLVLVCATAGFASASQQPAASAPCVGATYVAQGFGPAFEADSVPSAVMLKPALARGDQQQAPAAQTPAQPRPQTPTPVPPATQQPAAPTPPAGQTPQSTPPPAPETGSATVSPKPAGTAPAAAPALVVPPDYVIGADDILRVEFWRDKEMSTDVVVRPDGRITLPLLNDVRAGGLTPEQLRLSVRDLAAKYIEAPNVSVVVKQINSRRVFVMGQVGKPGAYPLSNPTTVLQLLSMAGGVSEFADAKKIVIMRIEAGKQQALKFNYRDVTKGKNLQQNILLKPGDTVVVP
jgi:polysaccharide export outer membrane protein